MPPNVLPAPISPWLYRPHRGHQLWCVKEQCFAVVDSLWEPPEPRRQFGRIGLRVHWFVQHWFVDNWGRGFDGKPLLLPVEGSFPELPEPASAEELQRLRYDITVLSHRLAFLERRAQLNAVDEPAPDLDELMPGPDEPPVPSIAPWPPRRLMLADAPQDIPDIRQLLSDHALKTYD